MEDCCNPHIFNRKEHFREHEQNENSGWFSESQLYLLTKENKIETRQELLKKSCPTCEFKLIISKGLWICCFEEGPQQIKNC